MRQMRSHFQPLAKSHRRRHPLRAALFRRLGRQQSRRRLLRRDQISVGRETGHDHARRRRRVLIRRGRHGHRSKTVRASGSLGYQRDEDDQDGEDYDRTGNRLESKDGIRHDSRERVSVDAAVRTRLYRHSQFGQFVLHELGYASFVHDTGFRQAIFRAGREYLSRFHRRRPHRRFFRANGETS